mmetsp:Transcript_73/g.172  ORF Transcript_73/g.172 Transcript_73/m.172 type:complete len:261 (+) Transcript_73:948-1730(+)
MPHEDFMDKCQQLGHGLHRRPCRGGHRRHSAGATADYIHRGKARVAGRLASLLWRSDPCARRRTSAAPAKADLRGLGCHFPSALRVVCASARRCGGRRGTSQHRACTQASCGGRSRGGLWPRGNRRRPCWWQRSRKQRCWRCWWCPWRGGETTRNFLNGHTTLAEHIAGQAFDGAPALNKGADLLPHLWAVRGLRRICLRGLFPKLLDEGTRLTDPLAQLLCVCGSAAIQDDLDEALDLIHGVRGAFKLRHSRPQHSHRP